MHRPFALLIAGIIFLAAAPALSQAVLYAPFYTEGEHVFEHHPKLYFNELPNGMVSRIPDFYKQTKIHAPYVRSYLTAEQPKVRMRVRRYVSFSDNPHLDGAVPVETWTRTNDKNYSVVSEGEEGANQRDTPVSFRPSSLLAPWDGVNIVALQASQDHSDRQVQEYRNWQQFIQLSVDVGLSTQDENGVLHVSESFRPAAFRVEPLARLMINALLNDGTLTAYGDEGFEPITRQETMERLSEQPEDDIRGLRLVEDYYVDPNSGELTSMLLGVGVIGTDATPGNELFWVYFPALRWVFTEIATEYGGVMINFENIFEGHHYNSRIEQITPMGTMMGPPDDSQWMVRLDLPVMELLWRESGAKVRENRLEELANGVLPGIRAQYKKGKLHGKMELSQADGQVLGQGSFQEGLPHGHFKFFYPDGSTRAVRNFKQGKLHGEQADWYPGGTGATYSEWQAEDGLPVSLTRYYEDGSVMESGNLKYGVMDGVWEYQIRASEAFIGLAKTTFAIDRLPGYDGNQTFRYKVRYSSYNEPNCYPIPPHCLKMEVVEEEE